jgi:hypothetical protein
MIGFSPCFVSFGFVSFGFVSFGFVSFAIDWRASSRGATLRSISASRQVLLIR